MKYSKQISAAVVAAAFAGGLWLGRADSTAAPQTIDASRFPSLQKALDALPASGGLVRLPPGRFEITEPLHIKQGDVRLVGAGTATHIVNRNTAGRPALIVGVRGYDSSLPWAERQKLRIWRVHLADFRISGNPKSGDGVLAAAVDEIMIHNVAIDHNGGHGISLIDCYEDPRIVNCILTYNGGAGLNIHAGHDIVVNANQFEENQDAVLCIDSFNLCMNGNNIDDHLRHGVVIENTYGSVLSGNMIEECGGTGIVLDRDAYGITLSANVLAHNNGGGVDLRDAWGSTVSANTFTIDPAWSLRIGPNSGRITVTGNNFSNSYVGGKLYREEDYTAGRPNKEYAAGVLLDGPSDITLTGNIFAGLIEEAVRATGETRRVTLIGNVVTDIGRKSGPSTPAFRLPDEPTIIKRHNITR